MNKGLVVDGLKEEEKKPDQPENQNFDSEYVEQMSKMNIPDKVILIGKKQVNGKDYKDNLM